MRRQIHQSGVDMAGKCGVQFEFRYIKGQKRKPNAFLMCGTATDRAVNTDLEHKIQTGELEQESVLTDVARDACENYQGKSELELDPEDSGKSLEQVIGETKDKTVRLVKAHHGRVAPEIQPFATARKFSIDLDKFLRERARELHLKADQESNRSLARNLDAQARYLNVAAREGLDFVGEMDIVERIPHLGQIGQVIRDTKTSSKSPNQDTADGSHQLTAYALASQVVDGMMPDAVKLDYLIDLKRETKTMTLESKRTVADVGKYLDRIVSVVIQMESGNFVPTSDKAWWCAEKWCAYHSICPYVSHRVTSLPLELTGVAKQDLVQIESAE